MLKSSKVESDSSTAKLNMDLENAKTQVRILCFVGPFVFNVLFLYYLGEATTGSFISHGNDLSSTSSWCCQ
jgi:uncharacterized membrane protein